MVPLRQLGHVVQGKVIVFPGYHQSNVICQVCTVHTCIACMYFEYEALGKTETMTYSVKYFYQNGMEYPVIKGIASKETLQLSNSCFLDESDPRSLNRMIVPIDG
jgi:hypothetical protein